MDARRGLGCVPAAAIVAAPFLALGFGPEAGLGAATIALATVSLLGLEIARHARPEVASRLRWLVGLNLMLAVTCAATLAWRLRR